MVSKILKFGISWFASCRHAVSKWFFVYPQIWKFNGHKVQTESWVGKMLPAVCGWVLFHGILGNTWSFLSSVSWPWSATEERHFQHHEVNAEELGWVLTLRLNFLSAEWGVFYIAGQMCLSVCSLVKKYTVLWSSFGFLNEGKDECLMLQRNVLPPSSWWLSLVHVHADIVGIEVCISYTGVEEMWLIGVLGVWEEQG